MDSSVVMSITSIYLIGLVLARLLDVLQVDSRRIKKPIKHPPENQRIMSLLAQYLPVDTEASRSREFWQRIQEAFYWLEPLAVVYFTFVSVSTEESRPLLIALISLGFVLLNNVWQAQEFSIRKKLRLTALLPAQILPYYAINLIYTLKDIYSFTVHLVRAFSSKELRFPLDLGLSEKRK